MKYYFFQFFFILMLLFSSFSVFAQNSNEHKKMIEIFSGNTSDYLFYESNDDYEQYEYSLAIDETDYIYHLAGDGYIDLFINPDVINSDSSIEIFCDKDGDTGIPDGYVTYTSIKKDSTHIGNVGLNNYSFIVANEERLLINEIDKISSSETFTIDLHRVKLRNGYPDQIIGRYKIRIHRTITEDTRLTLCDNYIPTKTYFYTDTEESNFPNFYIGIPLKQFGIIENIYDTALLNFLIEKKFEPLIEPEYIEDFFPHHTDISIDGISKYKIALPNLDNIQLQLKLIGYFENAGGMGTSRIYKTSIACSIEDVVNELGNPNQHDNFSFSYDFDLMQEDFQISYFYSHRVGGFTRLSVFEALDIDFEIQDNSPPTLNFNKSNFENASKNSSTLYLKDISSETYSLYYNSSRSTVPVYWNTVTDAGGSGVKSIKVFGSSQSLSNTSTTISTNALSLKSTIDIQAIDNAGNVGEVEMTYWKDSSGPLISFSGIVYNDSEIEDEKISVNLPFSFDDPPFKISLNTPLDPGSGLSNIHYKLSVDNLIFAQNKLQNSEADEINEDLKTIVNGSTTFMEKNIPLNQTSYSWDKTLNNMLCDIIYSIDVSATDNVGNETIYPTQHFGKTKVPIFDGNQQISDIFANDKLTVKIQLGRLYDDPAIGLESIKLTYDNLSNNSLDDSVIINVIDNGGLELSSDIDSIVYESDNLYRYATIKFKNIQYNAHDEIKLKLDGYVKNNQLYSAANLTDSPAVRKGLVVPNTPLSADNNVYLEVLNSQGIPFPTILPFFGSTQKATYYYRDICDVNIFALDANGNRVNYDVDEDVLTIKVERDPQTQEITSILVSDYPGSSTFFNVNERITFIQDTDINLENSTFYLTNDTSTEDNQTNTGNVEWNFTLPANNAEGSGFTDDSGLRQIAIIIEEGYDRQVIQNYPFNQGDITNRNFSDTYHIDSDSIEEGETANRNLFVEVIDWAGNIVKSTPESIYYDRKDPVPLNTSNTSSVIMDDATADIRYGSYDADNATITIRLDTTSYIDNETCTISASTNTTGYEISGFIDTSVNTSGSTEFVLKKENGIMPSNEPVIFTLTYTDKAGNTIDQNYTIYTPLILSGAFEDYLKLQDDQMDDNYTYYFRFQKVQELNLNLYKRINNNFIEIEYDSANNYFEDSHNQAHAYGIYKVTGVNHSGYEYDACSTITDFTDLDMIALIDDFTGDNHNPTFEVEETNAYKNVVGTGENKASSLSSESEITFRAIDADNDDLTLFAYLTAFGDPEPTSDSTGFPVDGKTIALDNAWEKTYTVSLGDLLSDEDEDKEEENYVENDKSYTLYFFLQDSWSENGKTEIGTFEIDNSFSFTYDNAAPDLTFDYEKQPGFSCIYGDININITDNFAALRSVEIAEDTTIGFEPTISDAGKTFYDDGGDPIISYSHVVTDIPDGEKYLLALLVTDQVGNERIFEIGPFQRDAVDPVISNQSVTGIDLTEGYYFINNGSVPINMEWDQSVETSGPELIHYRFLQDNAILPERETSIFDKDTAIWQIDCSINGLAINTDPYKLQIQLYDQAGNNSSPWVTVADNIKFDSAPPIPTITALTGAQTDGGSYYINSDAIASEKNSLSISYSLIEDNPLDGTEVYRIKTDDLDITDSSLDSLITDASLSEGIVYPLTIGVSDMAGNTGWSSPVLIEIDNSAPEIDSSFLTLSGTGGSYYSGGQLRFTLGGDAADGTSLYAEDIRNVSVSIGQMEGDHFNPLFSQKMTSHQEDGSILLNYSNGRIYSLNIPQIEDGDYLIQISATDKAQNLSDLVEAGAISINNDVSRVIIQDHKTYSNNDETMGVTLSFYAAEDETRSLSSYYYRIYQFGDSTPLTDYVYCAPNSSSDFTEIYINHDFEENQTYYFESYAQFSDGTDTKVHSSVSGGTYMDYTAPTVIDIKINDRTSQSYGTLNNLNLDWSAKDEATGIDLVQAYLKTNVYNTDGTLVYESQMVEGEEVQVPQESLIGPFTVGTSEEADNVRVLNAEAVSQLQIPDGENILVILQVSDWAGNMTEVPAGFFMKDESSPPVPVVLDFGEYINPMHNELFYDWSITEADPHSGEGSYQYQFLLNGESIEDSAWLDPSDKTYSLNIIDENGDLLPEYADWTDGSVITLAVKATNRAGLSSIGRSDGILIDRSKPDQASVVLGTFSAASNSIIPISYLFHDDILLSLNSQDIQSDILEYSYQPVTYREGQWVVLADAKTIPKNEAPSVEETLPANLQDYESLYYRSTAYNNTGDPSSLPGFSNTAINYKNVDLIQNITASHSADTILVSWEILEGISLSDQKIQLTCIDNHSHSLTEQTIATDATSFRFEGIEDGIYKVELSAQAEMANISDSISYAANLLLVDNTAPAIDHFSYDSYVYSQLNFSADFSDNLSGISRFRYQVGTVGQTGLLTNGWKYIDSNLTHLDHKISIDEDLEGGIEALFSSEGIILTLQVMDQSGNWSNFTYSNPIIVDKTAPSVPVVTLDRVIPLPSEVYGEERPDSYTRDGDYIVDPSVIDNLLISSTDDESGLMSYFWAIREDESTEDLQWTGPVNVEPNFGRSYVELLQKLEELSLDNDTSYRVYLKTMNKAYLVSEIAESEPFITDFNEPQFKVDTEESGLDYSDGYLIYNEAGNVYLELIDELSDMLTVEYSLTDPDGDVVASGTQYYLGRDEMEDLSIPYSPVDEEAFGAYLLSITMRDSGRYSSTVEQRIRLNAPPMVSLQSLVSNPMRPLDLAIWDHLTDADGVESVEIQIFDFEENLIDQYLEIPENTKIILTLGHPDSTPYAQTSVYRVQIESTDGYGQSGLKEIDLLIQNTSAGRLYTHEYWSGEHNLTGLVIVPDTLTLTVADSTEIQMLSTSEEDPPGLSINEGGSLIHEGTAIYDWASELSFGYWKGLEIRGFADLDNVTIRNAERGITLISSEVTNLTGLNLENNRIGIHLYGVNPTISNSHFTGNLFYAIKEDNGAGSTLIQNDFSLNGYPYYDSQDTVLSIEQLNSQSQNSGNTGE